MIVRPLVDQERIVRELEVLAGFSGTPKPTITRILYTSPTSRPEPTLWTCVQRLTLA